MQNKQRWDNEWGPESAHRIFYQYYQVEGNLVVNSMTQINFQNHLKESSMFRLHTIG